MKKILSLMLLMVIGMMGCVYAALSCNISLEMAKTEFSKGEEFTVDVKLSNIQSDRGVISLGATLEYDKDSLTLVKMEGQNGWETPANGVSYNEANGKMAITRSGLGKDDEIIFKMTFKVNDQSKKNLKITLKDITVADGTAPAKISLAYKNITIKDGVQEPETDDKNNNTTNSVENTTINNSLGNNSTDNIKEGDLPQTGESGVILIASIGVILVIAIILYIRMQNVKKGR